MDNKGIFKELQKFTAKDRMPWDKFGFSVSIDQSNAMIGSRFECEDEFEENTLDNAGAIYFLKVE